MTTIAVRDGTMAADSRCADGHSHVTKFRKVYRLKSGAIIGLAGYVDDVRPIKKLLDCVSAPDEMPAKERFADLKEETAILILFPSGALWIAEIFARDYGSMGEWAAQVYPIREKHFAIGSGAGFALAAMDCGKTPEEAVRVACKRDLYSAPPVVSMSVKNPRLTPKKKPVNSQKRRRA